MIDEVINAGRKKFEVLVTRKLQGDWLSTVDYRELIRLYLVQPEWLLLCKKVGERCKEICERCGIAPYQECHHKTYDRYFHENLDDLMGVCKDCHRELTRQQKEVKLLKVTPKQNSGVQMSINYNFVTTRRTILAHAKEEGGELFIYTSKGDPKKAPIESRDISIYGALGFTTNVSKGKWNVTNMQLLSVTKDEDLDILFKDYSRLIKSDFTCLEGVTQLINDGFNIDKIHEEVTNKDGKTLLLKYLKLHPELPSILRKVVPAYKVSNLISEEMKKEEIRELRKNLISANVVAKVETFATSEKVTVTPTVEKGIRTSLDPNKIRAAKCAQRNGLSIKKHLPDLLLLEGEGIRIEELDKEDIEVLFS